MATKQKRRRFKEAFARGVLSPTLFNIYSGKIFLEALEGSPEWIKINGETINNIRYADDTVILSRSLDYLQTLLDKINAASVKYGLNLNTSKTKYMVFTLERETIERVERYTYLGSMVNSNWDQSVEVKCRIKKNRI